MVRQYLRIHLTDAQLALIVVLAPLNLLAVGFLELQFYTFIELLLHILFINAFLILLLFRLNFGLYSWFQILKIYLVFFISFYFYVSPPYKRYLSGNFMLLSLSMSLAILLLLFVLTSRKFNSKYILVPISIFLIFSSSVTLIMGLPNKYEKFNRSSKNNISDKFEGDLSKFFFEEKPNIYILSFESLSPPEVTENLLGLTWQFPEEFSVDFNTIPNVITLRPYTTGSINNVMRLEMQAFPYRTDFFSGQHDSALSQILRQNDYEITTGYVSNYLGYKGEFVDHYIMENGFQSLSHSPLCKDDSTSNSFADFGFFACDINKLFKNLANPKFEYKSNNWHPLLISQIEKSLNSKRPQFFYVHTHYPFFHSSASFNYVKDQEELDSYISTFTQARDLFTNRLKELLGLIKSSPKSSIILVMGDHGMSITRNASSGNSLVDFQDRHGVYFGISAQSSSCTESLSLTNASAYTTPSRELTKVLLCLSHNTAYFNRIDFDSTKIN